MRYESVSQSLCMDAQISEQAIVDSFEFDMKVSRGFGRGIVQSTDCLSIETG